jgi:hypothetical protein
MENERTDSWYGDGGLVIPLEYEDGGLESESLRCSFVLV